MNEHRNLDIGYNLMPWDIFIQWETERFRKLSTERLALAAYMWQFPTAMIAIVALFLNSARTLSKIKYFGNSLLIITLLMLVIIVIFSIFLLARLHARRKLRDDKMLEVERRIYRMAQGMPIELDFSCITSSAQVDETAKISKSWIDRSLGRIRTITLGVGILILIGSLILLGVCFVILFTEIMVWVKCIN